MPGKIFISYRREDVAGDARGIRDALAARFGRANVFMDVDDLLAGQRFDKELSKALDDCNVLIAVIGPRWMDLLEARTQSGERDYVREEIAAALRRGIVVIPTRVGLEGRTPPLPRRDALPEDISDLVLHQKHDVVHERFGRDVQDLIVAIEATRQPFDSDVAKSKPLGQSYGQPDPAQLQPAPEQAHYASQQAYDADPDYDDHYEDADEEPRRSRRGLLIASALVGVIALGGGLAYTYKTFIALGPGQRAPLVKAGDVTSSKIKTSGREIPYTDKKVLDESLDASGPTRLKPDADGRADDDTTGPRKVRTISIPGIMLDGGPSPPTRVQREAPAKVAAAPPPRMQPAEAGARATEAAPAWSGAGFVAVLSSQKSRMDALKAYADLQQKYGEVLSSKTPEVVVSDLGDKGTWYRAVVGPPGSREAASGLCSQLRTAGYVGCWVTAY